jgi:hypothetical protein
MDKAITQTKDIKTLTLEEVDIILHASGYSHKGKQYRTHYCCAPEDPRLLKLTRDGIFSGPHRSEMLNKESAMFYLTQFGLEAAKNLHDWRRMP